MHSFYTELHCVTSTCNFEERLDAVMDAMQDEPGASTSTEAGVLDADVGANLKDGTVDFCLHLNAESVVEATNTALVFVRSALHKTGGATPGWDALMAALDNGQAEVHTYPANPALTP